MIRPTFQMPLVTVSEKVFSYSAYTLASNISLFKFRSGKNNASSFMIPTYRGAEFKALSEAIEVILLESKISVIIIADDHSPDGTIEIVESLEEANPAYSTLWVEICHWRVDGIDKAKSEFVVVMKKKKIPELLSMLRRYFVLGNRYIEGASFEKGWYAY